MGSFIAHTSDAAGMFHQVKGFLRKANPDSIFFGNSFKRGTSKDFSN
jgi:hypothetical protein